MATFEQKQAQEKAIVAAIVTNANRVAASLWCGTVDGVTYYVHERYSPRSGETWYTAHISTPHGPRVSNQ